MGICVYLDRVGDRGVAFGGQAAVCCPACTVILSIVPWPAFSAKATLGWLACSHPSSSLLARSTHGLLSRA